jgi:hypothetical protein
MFERQLDVAQFKAFDVYGNLRPIGVKANTVQLRKRALVE